MIHRRKYVYYSYIYTFYYRNCLKLPYFVKLYKAGDQILEWKAEEIYTVQDLHDISYTFDKIKVYL